jgi:hypothetical protein
VNNETKIGIRTEDGKIVHDGDRVYNYYDMVPCTIKFGPYGPTIYHEGADANQDIWFDTVQDDGRHSAILNGQRICTIEYAKRRGFRGA